VSALAIIDFAHYDTGIIDAIRTNGGVVRVKKSLVFDWCDKGVKVGCIDSKRYAHPETDEDHDRDSEAAELAQAGGYGCLRPGDGTRARQRDSGYGDDI
jgi:hypothetical protein